MRRFLGLGVLTLIYCAGVVFILFRLDEPRTDVESPRHACPSPQLTCEVKSSPPIIQYQQFGPGVNGSAVSSKELLDKDETFIVQKYYEKYDYNAFVSDLIPVQRTLQDFRPDICRQLRYPDHLPSVSVVIPFRNERLSVLLRTIYGLLMYSPEHLLAEIIMVDDASTDPDLKSQLDIHIQTLPKVKLIRKAENVGLMMARQAGIEASQTDYFICMDSHMEVSTGWLEPLLNRILENPKALLCSNIGSIDNDNFKVSHDRLPFGMAFDFPFFAWNLEQEQARYNEKYRLSRQNKTEPMLIGSVMGMMICMKKSWFLQLGGFDPGMRVWGSEQIELSVKVWMCGGVIEMIPCSFVAHMYRRVLWKIDIVGMVNKYRLVATWVDEPYRKIVYDYAQVKPSAVDIGDISKRIKVRETNKCKSFQYFLDRVSEFANIHLPINSVKIGSLRNTGRNVCLYRVHNVNYPTLYQCSGRGSMELFELSAKSELRHLGQCLYVETNDKVLFKHCDHFVDPSLKEWAYDEYSFSFLHKTSGKCLTVEDITESVIAGPCQASPEQAWMWEDVTVQ